MAEEAHPASRFHSHLPFRITPTIDAYEPARTGITARAVGEYNFFRLRTLATEFSAVRLQTLRRHHMDASLGEVIGKTETADTCGSPAPKRRYDAYGPQTKLRAPCWQDLSRIDG